VSDERVPDLTPFVHVAAASAQAYHPDRARLTLTRRQITAPIPAYARPRASAASRGY
jgi:hypothetical protein